MDCDVLTREVGSLLTSGTVKITDDHLYRGRGGILTFSLEVLDELFAQMSHETKKMLEEFQNFRRVISGVKESTGLDMVVSPIAFEELEGLRVENAMLKARIQSMALREQAESKVACT